jgi:hypothetical protein
MDKKTVEFRASFPAIQSAFKRHGAGSGMRVQLDIPETDVSDAIALMALTQCRLKVTVEVDEGQPRSGRD